MWCVLAVAFALACPVPSMLGLQHAVLDPPSPTSGKIGQPQQPKPSNNAKRSDENLRGSEAFPVAIKIINASDIKPETAPNSDTDNRSAAPEWWPWPRWWPTDWALATLTLGLVVVGVIQIFVFAVQASRLKQTIEAMKSMERNQLRAYVGVEKLEFELSRKKPRVGNRKGIFENFASVTVKNYGQTTAKSVVTVTYQAAVDIGQRLPDDYDFDATKDLQTIARTGTYTSRLILSPGQSAVTKCSLISEAVLEAIAQAELRKRNMYVFGRIYYVDIFGTTWRTKFCHVWEPWHAYGSRFVPFERHNDEDNEKLEDQVGTTNAPMDGSFQPTVEEPPPVPEPPHRTSPGA